MSGGTPWCAEKRETISRELSQKKSARYIAKLLGRHHSTIAREINRDGGAADYRAVPAQEHYEGAVALYELVAGWIRSCDLFRWP
jgi:IS30 family transposase